jgi:hypothetical protein
VALVPAQREGDSGDGEDLAREFVVAVAGKAGEFSVGLRPD